MHYYHTVLYLFDFFVLGRCCGGDPGAGAAAGEAVEHAVWRRTIESCTPEEEGTV